MPAREAASASIPAAPSPSWPPGRPRAGRSPSGPVRRLPGDGANRRTFLPSRPRLRHRHSCGGGLPDRPGRVLRSARLARRAAGGPGARSLRLPGHGGRRRGRRSAGRSLLRLRSRGVPASAPGSCWAADSTTAAEAPCTNWGTCRPIRKVRGGATAGARGAWRSRPEGGPWWSRRGRASAGARSPLSGPRPNSPPKAWRKRPRRRARWRC